MAATHVRTSARSWPIVYRRHARSSRSSGTAGAWALFLIVGIPFFLMTVLTTLARTGLYVDLFRPLWAPWPPDALKPFIGLAGFVATLGYLAYRKGHARGFRMGLGVGLSSMRQTIDVRPALPAGPAEPAALELPPPPPPESLD